MTETRRTITTETALRLLADQQRRQVLHRVAETQGATTVEALAEPLAANGGDPRTNGARRSGAVALRHVHLPALQQAAVVEYDRDRGTVEPGPHFGEVLSLCRVIEDHRADSSPP